MTDVFYLGGLSEAFWSTCHGATRRLWPRAGLGPAQGQKARIWQVWATTQASYFQLRALSSALIPSHWAAAGSEVSSWEPSLGASHMPSLLCIPPGQIWYQFSPSGRMIYMTKLRTLMAPGCAGSRTGCRRSWVSPSRSSTAVASSSTPLVFYPTAGPSPLWVSQDPG